MKKTIYEEIDELLLEYTKEESRRVKLIMLDFVEDIYQIIKKHKRKRK